MFGIVFMGLIGFSSPAMAQGYSFDNWSENAGAQWWNRDVPGEFALTGDQIAKINKIRAKSRSKILPLQKKLVSLQSKRRAYNGYDNRQFLSYKMKIDQLENKIREINLETRLAVRNVLGQHQLAYFDDGRYGWWDSADDCWYSPDIVSHNAYGRYAFHNYYDNCCR